MTRTEHLDQLDAILKEMVEDKTLTTEDELDRLNLITSGFEVLFRARLEELAASKGVTLWIDREEARGVDAARSRN